MKKFLDSHIAIIKRYSAFELINAGNNYKATMWYLSTLGCRIYINGYGDDETMAVATLYNEIKRLMMLVVNDIDGGELFFVFSSEN